MIFSPVVKAMPGCPMVGIADPGTSGPINLMKNEQLPHTHMHCLSNATSIWQLTKKTQQLSQPQS